MGDRCYLELRVHKEDYEKFKKWCEDDFEEESDLRSGRPTTCPDPVSPLPLGSELEGTLTIEEANYALDEDRESLAASGVRFVGSHGAGDNYPACYFFSDGHHQYEWSSDGFGGISIQPVRNEKGVSVLREEDLLRAQRFMSDWEMFRNLVQDSWKR